jgi:hypothetical protein
VQEVLKFIVGDLMLYVHHNMKVIVDFLPIDIKKKHLGMF